MFLTITELEGLLHPLIESAYLKRNCQGNTLIIETNFSSHPQQRRRDALETLLTDLGNLIEEVENDVMHLDLIDIRMGTTTYQENLPAA